MIKFRLNHTCNLSDARGVAGDIVDVSEERAQYLLARKGGKIVPRANPRVLDEENIEGMDEGQADVDAEGDSAAERPKPRRQPKPANRGARNEKPQAAENVDQP